MPGRRTTARPRYDGVAFRRLRERPCDCPLSPREALTTACPEHRVSLTTVLYLAAKQAPGGIEVCAHEHARQWERGQRNISPRVAHAIAAALSTATKLDIRPEDFEAGRVAA